MTQETRTLHTQRAKLERLAYIAAAVFACIVLIACSVLQINGAVMAQGLVSRAGENISLDHEDGGQIANVLVQNGDTVTAGQLLIQFDATALTTERNRLARQKLEDDVKLARLNAGLNNASSFGADNVNGRDALAADYADIVRTQTAALKAEQDMLNASIASANARARGADAARAALAGQIITATRRAETVAQEVADMQALVDEKLVSRARLTALQREQFEITQRLESYQMESTRLETEARSARLEITSLKTASTDRLWSETEEAKRRAADLTRQITQLDEKIARLSVTAPSDGRVHELSVRHAGAVVTPGGALLQIVPDATDSLVQVRLSPTDIEDVSIGQDVRLRFDTFQSLKAPELEGTILSISPDSSSDPNTGQTYFLARVSINNPERLGAMDLQSGTPVTALVTTRKRSLAVWLLEPLTDSFSKMFQSV